jgi:hypothetical protein
MSSSLQIKLMTMKITPRVSEKIWEIWEECCRKKLQYLMIIMIIIMNYNS